MGSASILQTRLHMVISGVAHLFESDRDSLVVRRLGCVEYEPTWRAMQAFTGGRRSDTADEVWLAEHPGVFTLGLGGDARHLLRDLGIPLIRVDRGGQITYHGPGQLMVYVLLDLRRRKLTVGELVRRLEQSVIELLAGYGIEGMRREKAPGVYVADAKIASLGLRIKNHACYHGLALNVAMDLSPFQAINVCGYEGLPVTQLADLGIADGVQSVGEKLVVELEGLLAPAR